MKAARYYGRRDLRVEDVDEPIVARDEVKLRIRFAGICGTDLHEYYAGPRYTRADEPHPLTGVRNPVILGHELCGEVVEVGHEVDDVQIGALAVIDATEYCGICRRCQGGERHLCAHKAIHGYTRAGGAFSEFTTAKRAMVHSLPVGISAQQGALIEPMAVGLAAARRTGISPGETAAVHGAGPIGLGTALALRADGARVLVVDPSPIRRRVAADLGLGPVIDPTEVDAVSAILDLTAGDGADGSVDAAGVPAALEAAIASTAYDRNVTIVAVPQAPITLPLASFRSRLVRVSASTGQQDFPATIDRMARGDYPLGDWVSTIELDRIVRDGFEALHHQQAMKVLVDLTVP